MNKVEQFLQKHGLKVVIFLLILTYSKKYKVFANNTKASFCITTKNLQNELPKNCIPIIVDNVLVSTSLVTAKFYPDSINDNFDITVEEINNTKIKENKPVSEKLLRIMKMASQLK